ncbi:biopolymer transporter ExbD [Leptolyngbya cf. ectocarpi LEGE 11479]|uniref:Biopolymer transporter ExbD n=1 Tax=Leptolyngbya cf. ectocarpi LEGE 11479 TaxID=1828722 RepID=A0A929A0D4_LEPEC|nr:biopolymer transporter ExbD [Leptolyngbya ectocarpi]MBE9070750.1 biopolymer transporter ExbD [Leptolyngbya cf. ectocarpi LEGE 11479]
MQLPPDEDPRLTINIVPMIDVVFAVLAFFILSTLYLTRAEGLPVTLPTATTAENQDEATLTLTITADGELYLGTQPVTLEALPADVQALIAPGQPALVTVRADAATPHGQVVAAMDRIRDLEGVRLGIATQQP